MRRQHQVLTSVVAAILLCGLAWAHSDIDMGPVTGAPGEGDCTSCHGGVANSGPGTIGISAPADYVAGDTITLDLSLAETGLVRWGFQLTALDAGDQPAGQFIITDSAHTRATLDSLTGRVYIWHTKVGTYDGTPDASPGWSVQWTTPAGGTGPVTFYMAGLAANSVGPNGDSTYTASHTIDELVPTDVNDRETGVVPKTFALAGNFPNPFNPGTDIAYQLPVTASIELTIFNLLGQEVRTLVRGVMPAGTHQVSWDGTDSRGRRVAGGVYFVRLVTTDTAITRKMLLLK